MVPFKRFRGKYHMNSRPLCPSCNLKPVAVNYVKDNKQYYRKFCDSCSRKGKKLKPKPPAWAQKGYKKKPHCEKCGFASKHVEQLNVFHVDGNLKNNDWVNLKTICLNCTIEVFKSKLRWKPGG